MTMPQFDKTHVSPSEPNQEVSSPILSENALETPVEETAKTQKKSR